MQSTPEALPKRDRWLGANSEIPGQHHPEAEGRSSDAIFLRHGELVIPYPTVPKVFPHCSEPRVPDDALGASSQRDHPANNIM